MSNVKALVGAFNQEKALVGAFCVIVKSSRTFVGSSNDRFSPEEVRAIFFQPLMVEQVRFLKRSLESAIDGMEEMERKTAGMAEHLKEKLGMMRDEEIDNDTAAEMKTFLNTALSSVIR